MERIKLTRHLGFLSLLAALYSGFGYCETFKYSELITKDYDEMSRMVSKLVNESVELREDGNGGSDTDANDRLRTALRLIFSRPNSDNMIAKLIPDVRRQLIISEAYEDTIDGLVNESIAQLKDKKAASSARATSLVMLENILAEVRPELPKNEKLRKAVKTVQDSRVRVDNDVTKELKLRGMFKAENPSNLARKILKSVKIEE